LALTVPATGHSGEVGVHVEFTDLEVSAIRAYFRANDESRQGKSPGKGKGRKSLPPGIAKNLQRGKPLPPGIAKQHLPGGLVQLLPAAPRGYERIIVDGKVLLVEVATQIVHDVLEDLILG
jgi:hypothetical protein